MDQHSLQVRSWAKWSGWHDQSGLNPLSCDVKHFLEFYLGVSMACSQCHLFSSICDMEGVLIE